MANQRKESRIFAAGVSIPKRKFPPLPKSYIGKRKLGWNLLPSGNEHFVFEGKADDYNGMSARP